MASRAAPRPAGPRRQRDPSLIERGDDGPLVFVGPPGDLRASLRLHNQGDRRAVIRGTQLRGSAPASGIAASRAVVGRVGHQTVLPTGRDQLLPLTAAVGPTTPPGVYDFHLDIAGHSYPAKVHVTELVGLEVSPARLVIQDGPGVRVVKRVVVSNVGNVPVTIGASADVALRADVPRADAAQERLARLCRQLAGLGDEPGEAPPGDLKAIGHLKVRITDGAGRLAPGEVVELAIETTVPARLPAGARLVGTAVLVTADLEFVVVTAPPVVAVPPRRPNPAPRPPRKKAG